MRNHPVRSLALIAALVVSSTAFAVPTQVTHQGRLFDALGVPMSGPVAVEFAIFDTPSGGSAIWSESHTPNFDEGYYSVELGLTSDLDDAIFDTDDVYISIAVNGGPELMRQKIGSMPFAIVAGSLDGGTVNAAEVQINGTTVIDGSGNIPYTALTGVPASSDTLLDLNCSGADTVARFDGSNWACAADNDHQHVAGDITGSLTVGQLPVGNTSAHVSAGDHGHSDLTLTGSLQGTSAEFSGGVRVGDASSAGCTSSNAGTLQWNAGELQVCSGSVWFTVTVTGPGSGATSGTAGTDCAAIINDYPSSLDGSYWIDPTGSSPFQAYCDMSSFGGGWTLIVNLDTSDTATRYYTDTAFWTSATTFGSAGTPWLQDFKSQAFNDYSGTELMISAHNDGAPMGAAHYDLIGGATGQTLHWMLNNLSNTTITNARKDNVGSAIASSGSLRVGGDAFVDNAHPVIVNSNFSPLDSANLTRIGTNYSSVCSTINCNGHNFGGIGGRHFRGGWGTDYEAAALNGYCDSHGSYGTNGQGYNGNNAFFGGNCGNHTNDPVDLAVWIR